MARGLLLLFRWNKDKLVEKFTDDENLIPKTFNTDFFDKVSAEDKAKPFMCGCCYMEAMPEEREEMECNHPLCSECYTDYLKSTV